MAGEIDTTAIINELLPSLHADSVANLVWWTKPALIQYMDQALKKLARTCGVFVERDTSITTSNGVGVYALPDRQDATLHASFDTTSLRPASMIELEMRDPDFQTTSGTPDHWYEDGQGWHIGVTPVPTQAKTIALIMTAWPPELDSAEVNHLVQAPAPLAGYLAMAVLAGADGGEGEAEMPDVAKHCDARCQMYEKVFAHYYGAGL